MQETIYCAPCSNGKKPISPAQSRDNPLTIQVGSIVMLTVIVDFKCEKYSNIVYNLVDNFLLI